jgi:alanine racemase
VVKAGGYGHGAVFVGRAALEAGASSLAVAVVEEGIELRCADIRAPVLVLTEPGPQAMVEALVNLLTPTIYTTAGIESALAAVKATRRGDVGVHLKVDTGMHRLGADPDNVVGLARAVQTEPRLHLEGLWTHLPVADEPDNPYTADQLVRFESVQSTLEEVGLTPRLVHAANSAGTIAHPRSHYDLVRCGIALYGYVAPALKPVMARHSSERSDPELRLRPVLSLRAQVSMVRALDAGERPSYGRRRPLPERSVVATVPLGYADGVPRRLFDSRGEVLVGGRRRPLAGVVTMDHIVVDCGADATVAPGDEVVLIGRQEGEEITADEWARRLGTISYEVLTSIGPRIPRISVGVAKVAAAPSPGVER